MNANDIISGDVYEKFAAIQRSFKDLLTLLDTWNLQETFLRDKLAFHRLRIEYFRSVLLLDLLECLLGREQKVGAKLDIEIRRWENRMHDPDDIYLEVACRERERVAQGLPARIRLLGESNPEVTVKSLRRTGTKHVSRTEVSRLKNNKDRQERPGPARKGPG